MPATWEIHIDVIDLQERRVRVAVRRTEGADVWDFSLDDAKYDTANKTPAQLREEFADNIWDHYQRHVAQQSQIAAMIGQAETALANALMAKEG